MTGTILTFEQGLPPQSGTLRNLGEVGVTLNGGPVVLNETFVRDWTATQYDGVFDSYSGPDAAVGLTRMHFAWDITYSVTDASGGNPTNAQQFGSIRMFTNSFSDRLPTEWVESFPDPNKPGTRYQQHVEYDVNFNQSEKFTKFVVVRDAGDLFYDPQSNQIPQYAPGFRDAEESLSLDATFPAGWVAVPFYLTFEYSAAPDIDPYVPYTFGRWFVFGDPGAAAVVDRLRMRRVQRDDANGLRRNLGAGTYTGAGSMRRGPNNRAI